eukprot:242191-Pelagomonas_calceolata.AAC.1
MAHISRPHELHLSPSLLAAAFFRLFAGRGCHCHPCHGSHFQAAWASSLSPPFGSRIFQAVIAVPAMAHTSRLLGLSWRQS